MCNSCVVIPYQPGGNLNLDLGGLDIQGGNLLLAQELRNQPGSTPPLGTWTDEDYQAFDGRLEAFTLGGAFTGLLIFRNPAGVVVGTGAGFLSLYLSIDARARARARGMTLPPLPPAEPGP